MLIVELLPELTLRPGDQLIELRRLLLERLRGLLQLAGEVLRAARALLLLGLKPIAQRLDFLSDELIDRREAFLHFLAEIDGLLREAFLQARELAVVVAHLDAEQE